MVATKPGINAVIDTRVTVQIIMIELKKSEDSQRWVKNTLGSYMKPYAGAKAKYSKR
jgi:hypothetical protein